MFNKFDLFGIAELRNRVDELAMSQSADVQALTNLKSYISSIKADLNNMAVQIAELRELSALATAKANGVVTPHRADELAVAISKCSLDMAELDRRLCALENAITIVSNRKYAAARAEKVTLDDDGIDELAKVFEKAAWGHEHLSAGKALTYKRIQARKRAERVLDTDADAREIRRRAKMWNIDERIITAGLAAGVVDYGRKSKLSEIVIKLSYRDNAVAKYGVTISAQHRHTPCYGSESEQVKALNDARRFIDVCRDHFNPSTVIGHA